MQTKMLLDSICTRGHLAKGQQLWHKTVALLCLNNQQIEQFVTESSCSQQRQLLQESF